MLDLILIISCVIIFAALIFAAIRLYRGPSVVDRIVIFDLFSSIAIGLMGCTFIFTKNTQMLDVGILLSVVVFVGTIAFAKFVEKGDGK